MKALRSRCERCKEMIPNYLLNFEATIHHGARRVECISRKACDRRVRKRKERNK